MKITKKTASKVLAVVDQGLVKGLGKPIPGQMCVEAAVCFALGLPHSDEPQCVSPAVRALKIVLNDAEWSSDTARTAGLRKLAILQLGTNDNFDDRLFAEKVAMFTINTILADQFDTFDWGHETALALRAADSLAAARSAAKSAAWSAARSAESAAKSAESAARSAWSAARSAESAAKSAESAAKSAESAARSAWSAVGSAESAARDKVLAAFAEGVASILISMGVQGAKWLGLL